MGDGEAETGPLATSWHLNKFINAKTDGAVLPILHLNGYKIANPTLFARISHEELEDFFRGCGWEPHFVEGNRTPPMHRLMADTLDECIEEILAFQKDARENGSTVRPRWPMIVLRSPKGWTGPAYVDGLKVEDYWRAHQVPIQPDSPEHIRQIEEWLKSYRPEELFDENGVPVQELLDFPPKGTRRMGANPHANGGLLLKDLRMPDFREYGVDVSYPGAVEAQDMSVLGTFVRDIYKLNEKERSFRPSVRMKRPPTVSPRSLRRPTERGTAEAYPTPTTISPPTAESWTRCSRSTCARAARGLPAHRPPRLFQQLRGLYPHRRLHGRAARKVAQSLQPAALAQKIASLNYVLASNVWQQDHNGFTHQDPGFLDHVANKKADVVRLYLPPDANCLLSCFDHCIRSRNYVNVIVASKHPRPQWLTMEQAVKHCTQGIGIWQWASTDEGEEPDIVMACCGDTPTLETLAAVTILREAFPELRIRVVNVVDLMRLQSRPAAPHGLSQVEYDSLFTKDKPIIFAFHGYPSLIHEMTYKRHNKNIHVRGYIEEGTITTPFDMRAQPPRPLRSGHVRGL